MFKFNLLRWTVLLLTFFLASQSFAVDINTKGKLELTSDDGQHSFRIGGRLQWDTTLVSSDGDMYSGTSESQIRRARLYLSGTTYEYWDFKFQFDFEDTQDDDQAIEDAYIRYTGLPVKIKFGQAKTPYSMHELTSSKYLTFIERSPVSELFSAQQIGVGNREMGITFTKSWKDMLWGADILTEGGYYLMRTTGGSGGSNSCSSGNECDIDDGQGVTGRIVFSDYDQSARQLMHLGVAGGYKHYANDIVERFRVRPGVSEGDRIIDTNEDVRADGYTTFNIQLAGMYQRFWANAEYYHGSFDITDPSVSGDDGMSGYYIQGGFFLTDDSRRYKNGAWDSVKPSDPAGKERGIGAWEIALRYDDATLGSALNGAYDHDDNPSTPDIRSGADQEGGSFGVALNWYPINNLRFQANYIQTICDACDWSPTGGDEPSFFVLRGQIYF